MNTILVTVRRIDQLLGGLESGHIYEICGLSGAGKTQICLGIAAHTSVSGRCVHFIDTKNDFSAKRIFDIISRKQSVKNVCNRRCTHSIGAHYESNYFKFHCRKLYLDWKELK